MKASKPGSPLSRPHEKHLVSKGSTLVLPRAWVAETTSAKKQRHIPAFFSKPDADGPTRKDYPGANDGSYTRRVPCRGSNWESLNFTDSITGYWSDTIATQSRGRSPPAHAHYRDGVAQDHRQHATSLRRRRNPTFGRLSCRITPPQTALLADGTSHLRLLRAGLDSRKQPASPEEGQDRPHSSLRARGEPRYQRGPPGGVKTEGERVHGEDSLHKRGREMRALLASGRKLCLVRKHRNCMAGQGASRRSRVPAPASSRRAA